MTRWLDLEAALQGLAGLASYLREWLRGIVAAGGRKNATGVVVWKAPREKDDDATAPLAFRKCVGTDQSLCRQIRAPMPGCGGDGGAGYRQWEKI